MFLFLACSTCRVDIPAGSMVIELDSHTGMRTVDVWAALECRGTTGHIEPSTVHTDVPILEKWTSEPTPTGERLHLTWRAGSLPTPYVWPAYRDRECDTRLLLTFAGPGASSYENNVRVYTSIVGAPTHLDAELFSKPDDGLTLRCDFIIHDVMSGEIVGGGFRGVREDCPPLAP